MDVSRAGRVDAGEQLREGFFLLFGEGLLDGAFGPRSRRILQDFTSLLDFAGILEALMGYECRSLLSALNFVKRISQ